MMIKLAFGILIGTLALATMGCSRPTASNLRKVQKGMTPEQVEGIMGAPLSVEKGNRDTPSLPDTFYRWENGREHYVVAFRDGKVTGMDLNVSHTP
jgi:hypothetical protein